MIFELASGDVDWTVLLMVLSVTFCEDESHFYEQGRFSGGC